MIKELGFVDLSQHKRKIYDKLNVFAFKNTGLTNWKFEEAIAFGSCCSPYNWRQEAGLSVIDNRSGMATADVGVISSLKFKGRTIKKKNI